MPLNKINVNYFGQFNLSIGIKAFLVLFLVFYAVFVLVIYRQILVMNNKLPTSLSPFLKFVGLLQIGIALAVLFLIIGIF